MVSSLHRRAYANLLSWKQDARRMPLLMRGARQVGKSYLINEFARQEFEHFVEINFELEPKLKECFQTLDPFEITKQISLIKKIPLENENTFLFLDEIQDCPPAIQSLRYFKEKMPALAVAGAGSLLEFAFHEENFRMPVGRVQSLYLSPLSFKEFLVARGYDLLKKYIEECDLKTKISESVHEQLLRLLREYMILGGMPAVLASFLDNQNYLNAQQQQTILLNSYRKDFSKYHAKIPMKTLQTVYDKVPGLVAQEVKYVDIARELDSRAIKNALLALEQADLLQLIYASKADGLPLSLHENVKRFKLLFLDVGLVMRHSDIEPYVLLNDDLLLLNRGAIAEQFVGQELLAAADIFSEPKLHFWSREKAQSQAEIDYVISVNNHIIPIEVKAGKTGRLRSLQIFMEEHHSKIGVQLSSRPLDTENKILKIPLYLTSELKRLLS